MSFDKLLKTRYRVLGLLFVLSSITFLDRVCISVAGPRMQTELGISPQMWGWVIGVFTISYSLFEIPSGALGDRFGARKMLTRIVIWWSVFTTLTGWVTSFRSLLLVRFLFGAGEAGAYPNSSTAIARWFPVAERARAQGTVWVAGLLGAALAPMLVVPIQMRYGWRASFFCFGSLGVAWAVIWYWWFRDNPTRKAGVSAAELSELASVGSARHVPLPWRTAVRNPTFWKLLGAYHCYCFGSNFYIAWLHTYLVRGRHMSESQMQVFSTLPFFLGAASNLAGGWLSDALVRRHGLSTGRRALGTAGLAGGGLFLIAAVISTTPVWAVVFLTLAYAGMTSTLPCSWALCLDIGRKSAGSLTGAMNTAGQLGALISTVAYGYLVVWWNGYDTPLLPLAAALLIGAWLYHGIDPCVRLFEDPEPHLVPAAADVNPI